ncbi:hypothetical protein HZ326_14379 [Fusarium oxysporum f. sp. albedinis]|nr:hypothetical protein HZ326_14379 [Fusarium oxysporum f. sp. albedinis]
MRQTLLRSLILALIFNSNGLKPVISYEMPSTDWSTMFTSLHTFGTPAANPSLSPQQLRRTPYLFIAKTCLFQEEKVQNLNPIVDIGDRNDKSHVAETRILIGVWLIRTAAPLYARSRM